MNIAVIRWGLRESFGELMTTPFVLYIIGIIYIGGGAIVSVIYWIITGHNLINQLFGLGS